MKTFPIIAIQSPRSSEFLTRSEEYLFWKKRLLVSISIFAPLIMADETDAVMADVSRRLLLAAIRRDLIAMPRTIGMVDGTVNADRQLLTLCVQWLLPYFLKLLATYNDTPNDVVKCNQPVKKHVSEPTLVY